MATNNRLWYAVKALGVAPRGSTSYTAVHGVQSLGIDTTFNLEKILELGQSALYELKEEVPDVSVNISRVCDGYAPIYLSATQQATDASLIGRSSAQCGMALSIFQDTYNSASGIPQREVQLSGLFVNSVSYSATVDGNCTEDLSLVCNDKAWLSGAGINFTGNIFTNNDSPQAITGSGGVQRRQHVVFGTTADTILPADIEGISSSGTNDQSGGVYGAHVQSIKISADLNRNGLRELGRKGNYFRFVGFPVDVQTQVEIITKNGDLVNALAEADNLSYQTIQLKLQDGLKVNCGSRNKLTGVTFGGGDTSGGNDNVVYSYTNANDFTCTHPNDPNTALR
jgi:hypothetical protein